MSSLAWYVYSEFVGIFILLVWAMYLPFRGGQLYNGPIYCMTIGAYAAAYTAKNLHWPFGWALLLAVVIGTIVGFLTSFAFSRTTGIVTATASLALIFILQSSTKESKLCWWCIGDIEYPKDRLFAYSNLGMCFSSWPVYLPD